MLLALLLLGPLAHAETPLPSFRAAVVDTQYRQVDALINEGCQVHAFPVLCTAGTIERAVAAVDAFQRTVAKDGDLEYLAGLALRYGGRETEALHRFESALAMDETLVAAWYDLGELRMMRGDYPGARTAFDHVRALPVADKPWVGSWRVAEVCALQHDAPCFEQHIKEALRDGFSFRFIAGLPNWRGFYADPALRDTLDKLLTVYADSEIRSSLE